MTATWKRVPQHDAYEASDDGRIRLAATKLEISQKVDRSGYLFVNLSRSWGRGRAPRYVHRLVALAFLGPQPTPDHTDVAHWDGDQTNNALTNLRWATPAENARDKIRHRAERLGLATAVPHPTCIDVTGTDQTPRSEWACGPACPKEA